MDYVAHLANIFLIFAILGISFNLLLGYTGLLSLCHAAFYGLGAYGSALLAIHTGASFLEGMLVGIAVAAIAGVIISIPALKVKDEYLVILTIGFQMVVHGLMVSQIGLTGGNWGLLDIPRLSIFGFELTSPPSALPLILVFFVICFVISWRIVRSPFGRVLKAMREDESATISLGKNILVFKVTVFAIAAGLAAIGGSIYAHYNAIITPGSFSFGEMIFIAAIVIIGGSANLWGSVLAAFLLIMIPEMLTFVGAGISEVGPIRLLIYGLLLVLFMRFRPQGMLPENLGFRRKAPVYEPPSPEERDEILRRRGNFTLSGQGKHKLPSPLLIEGLSKHFAGITAADNVRLELPEGKITALIGPNGAGKTTIFNMVTGFLKAESGKVYLRGYDISGLPPHRISRLGVVRTFQDIRIFRGMSVLDNVMVAIGNQSGENLGALFFLPWKVNQQEKNNYRRAMAYLDFVGLSEKAGEMAGDLSFAEQKMLALARLLATGADVMLIDEVVSGIDPNSVERVLALVHQLSEMGTTILIIEHNLDVVQGIANLTYFLASGCVIAKGTPSKLMADPKLVDLYFGA